MESAMLALLLILVGLLTYMIFSPTSLIGPWLDRHCKKERESWCGSDVEPEYNTNQDIHDAISQEKVPFTPSLDVPFDDPEVPNRPSKKKKPKKKRVYKRRKKK